MLTFHLDLISIDQFIQRVLHEVDVRMQGKSYRVVEVDKLNNVRIKGYYLEPTEGYDVGRSEYNATVSVSVNVYTLQGTVLPITFDMNNPLDLQMYNLEIERVYSSLGEVRANEKEIAEDYFEAIQTMTYLLQTGIYAKSTYLFISPVEWINKSALRITGEKVCRKISRNGYSSTDIVGFTCKVSQDEYRTGKQLWNVLSYSYLHEFLSYKQGLYTLNTLAEHEQGFKALKTNIHGIQAGHKLLGDTLSDYDNACIQYDFHIDEATGVPYFDVIYFAENQKDIIEWYHFTPLSGLRLVQKAESVSYEVVFDTHLHDYDYIIESYKHTTPFISKFFTAYKELM